MKLYSPTRASARPFKAAPRPRLACEISPSGVAAGYLDKSRSDLVASFSALPPGAVAPSLKSENLIQPKAVVAALRKALEEVNQRETTITLVILDAALRVLILDFDSLPSKRAEALPILRFRLRKLVPFDIEAAAVSYQILSAEEGVVRVLAAVIPAAVLKEYEGAVREAGYEPGAVLPSTLAALAAVERNEPALVVNRNGYSVTTAITRKNELLLHRTLDLTRDRSRELTQEIIGGGSQSDDRISAAAAPLLARPEHGEGAGLDVAVVERQPDFTVVAAGLEDPVSSTQVEELRSTVSVAIAYFEDTLGGSPDVLWASGAGGAEGLARLLGDLPIPVRDLFAIETGATTFIPPGMLAGVRGALSS